MTINGKLRLIAIFPGITLIGLLTFAALAYASLRHDWTTRGNAAELQRHVFIVSTLTYEYIQNRESRAAAQWVEQMAHLENTLLPFESDVRDPDHISMDLLLQEVGPLFQTFTNSLTETGPDAQLKREWIASQLADRFQQLNDEVEGIRTKAETGFIVNLRDFTIGTLVLGAGVMLGLSGLAWSLAARIASSLRRLHRAALAMASGNLDFQAETGGADEHAALAVSLNEMAANLQANRARLEAANNELETFAYSVSHDLRAPLRAVDGFSRILVEEYAPKLDSEAHRLISIIRENTTKMAQMIDDILQLSRAGRVELSMTPTDMRALVQSVIEELAPVTEGRTIEFEIGELAPAYCDNPSLKRVWMNLLDNAVKFTRGQTEAKIQIGSSTQPGEIVYFVRDNGVGFDMLYVDKLFKLFQRLHGLEIPGTGVGLSIVKRIVTRHGGRVWAVSKLDQGATFYFSLPSRGHE